MNKKTQLFFTLLLCILLAACSQENQESESTTAPAETTANAPTHEEDKTPEQQDVHWSYEGETGPEHWGELHPDYALCTNGTEQSPINIDTSELQASELLDDMTIHYEPTTFTVINNGHTIQANAAEMNNSILIGEKEYQLAQFHFHTPSEHQFNDKHFEMELHFVHKNDEGKLAVLGVMIKEGKENKPLQQLWEQMPTETTTEGKKLDQSVDILNILPENKTTFQYSGSLTTPPCSEGVKWLVLEQPIEMSKEQIEAFQNIFPHNNRPIQPLNEREVLKK
ncbi:carbonic anhydrase [Bacillus taeanensis]|uniref:carbonic anhydrase n=1 Tax=Bacillus taeanensis TaxID=273032 RepID=A0A366XWZ8_9BACI|nr:carbonic anhydrase family protein [Bacillus taeanensis]RBW68471.1 carbonic anhydrase [Bacillus taeanensis]